MRTQTKRAFIVFLIALTCVAAMCGCGQKEELSFEASYAIDADLDPEIRSMTYTETAEILNTGSDSAEKLYFHIYGNKFKGLRQVEDGDIAVLSIQNHARNTGMASRRQKAFCKCFMRAQIWRYCGIISLRSIWLFSSSTIQCCYLQKMMTEKSQTRYIGNR